jgi:hypothetical protein
VTADLVRQALHEQTTELTVILSASAFQRLRVFVVVPLDVKDGVLEAEGLQRGARFCDCGGGGDETRPAACPESCPVEPLCESVASMETFLREWLEGLGGSLSVRELEERPAILRPEEASKEGRDAGGGGGGGGLAGGSGGGDGPCKPIAGQVSQGIG